MNMHDYERTLAGQPLNSKNAKYGSLKQRVIDMVQRYGTITKYEYLRGIAHLFQLCKFHVKHEASKDFV